MARIAALLSLVFVAAASTLDAQDGDLQLEPSSRVRLWPADGSKPIIGVLHQVDSGSVAIGTSGATLLVLPRDSVARMDISRGVRANTWRGLRNGALIGSGIGVVLGMVAWATEDGYFVEIGGNFVLIGAGSGAVAGGLIGMGAGALSRSEHWSSVPMDRISVRPLATRRAGRTLIGLRIVR